MNENQITSRLSRRTFHRRAAGFALGALVPLAFAQGASAETKFPEGRFFDMHTHLGQPWNRRGKLSAEMLLRWMDAHKIAQAVVLPLVSPEAWFYPLTTDFVLKETGPFRDRLIPFCAIDPRTGHLDHRGKVDILKRYIDAGAKGFGEHKPGVTVDDPRNIALF